MPSTASLPSRVTAPKRGAAAQRPVRRHVHVQVHVAPVAGAPRRDVVELDRRVGDGDTGTTLARAARALVESVEQLPLANGPQLLQAIAATLSRVMGGRIATTRSARDS